MPKTINIISDHGLGPDRLAFVVDAESGLVIRATVDVKEFGSVPYSFDVLEFRDHYGYLPDTIDVLDIAYTLHDGTREPPEPEARMGIMRERYFEAVDHLSNVTASLENVLCHHGKGMTPADRKGRDDACHAAREFMHRVNYNDDAGEEDKSKLPAGVIQSRSNTGPCYGCGAQLNHGDLVLLNTYRKTCFCSRECLDEYQHGHSPTKVVIPDNTTLPPGVAVYNNNSLVPCWGADCDNAAGIGDEFLLDPETSKTYCSVACLQHPKNA
jgi:hypothetical protein